MERRDLTPQEEAVYGLVLEQGKVPVAEVKSQPNGEEALTHLMAFGLLATNPLYPDVVVAVDPALAVARQSSRVLEEIARDLGWVSRLPQNTATLAQQYWTAQKAQSGLIEVVRGAPAIGQRLELLLDSCRTRMLTVHPEASRRAPEIESVLGRDLDVIQRGADVRILYLAPVRRQVAVQAYVKAVTAVGARVRTLPRLPLRQFVIDNVVIVPYQGDVSAAVFIQDPSTVAAMVEVFELLWTLGEDFTPRTSREEQVEETLLTVMRMLVEGASTRQIARELGLSERMVTRLRAEISDEYDTDSAVRLGWLLRERYPNGIK
ncbi:LuxR C-terminal-related transcriptional regulator [Streptacidiphilus carbonis]|uniref:LuxR C-terminal-related transcriptional regulator n=1 Tax=Streptacidiphilus carbonis TaxID=105422 RepID=UPI0005A8EDFC|nr:LuxR C-terminal-related transcriptional regulator [Streptacidiphilus carbonis]